MKLVAACCQPDKLEELVMALAKHTQEATRAHGIAAFVQMLSPGLHAWLQSGHGFDRLRSCCLVMQLEWSEHSCPHVAHLGWHL